MARIEDYNKAFELAQGELRNRNPVHVCRLSGAHFIEKKGEPFAIRLTFLNEIITIRWPDLLFQHEPKGDIPIKQKIVILHYLNGSTEKDPTGELIGYQDIPSAKFYLDAFNRRVKHPLVSAFGEQPDTLLTIATGLFAATPSSIGDASVVIQALPKIQITLVIWRGDEEFASDGTILFDSSIQHILSPEDISELTSMIVYPILAKAS